MQVLSERDKSSKLRSIPLCVHEEESLVNLTDVLSMIIVMDLYIMTWESKTTNMSTTLTVSSLRYHIRSRVELDVYIDSSHVQGEFSMHILAILSTLQYKPEDVHMTLHHLLLL